MSITHCAEKSKQQRRILMLKSLLICVYTFFKSRIKLNIFLIYAFSSKISSKLLNISFRLIYGGKIRNDLLRVNSGASFTINILKIPVPRKSIYIASIFWPLETHYCLICFRGRIVLCVSSWPFYYICYFLAHHSIIYPKKVQWGIFYNTYHILTLLYRNLKLE